MSTAFLEAFKERLAMLDCPRCRSKATADLQRMLVQMKASLDVILTASHPSVELLLREGAADPYWEHRLQDLFALLSCSPYEPYYDRWATAIAELPKQFGTD